MVEGTVSLRVDSEDVSLGLMARAMNDLNDIVSDISVELLGKDRVGWVVDTLSRNSPALVKVRPVARNGLDAGASGQLSTVLRSGLLTLNARPEWPPYFSERALERLRMLARQASDSVRVQLGPEDDLIDLSSTTASNIDRLLIATDTALGAIEGRIESVTIHNTPEFSLYDLLDGRRVRCFFGSRIELADIRPGIGHRVSVYGTMKARQDGTVLSMTAEEIEVLPTQDSLPDFRTVRGILDAG